MTLSGTTLQYRYASGGEYLRAVATAATTDWLSLYDRYKLGTLSHAVTMSLIHPSWYIHKTPQDKICGQRSHGTRVLRSDTQCGSSLLWGYECPYGFAEHADHLFPYSAGGTTDSRNLILLCQTHNRMKNDDIHVYTWEQPVANWVHDAIRQIKATTFTF